MNCVKIFRCGYLGWWEFDRLVLKFLVKYVMYVFSMLKFFLNYVYFDKINKWILGM